MCRHGFQTFFPRISLSDTAISTCPGISRALNFLIEKTASSHSLFSFSCGQQKARSSGKLEPRALTLHKAGRDLGNFVFCLGTSHLPCAV